MDLGTIWASIGLNTAPLAAGAAQAKGMITGLDASVSKVGAGSTASLANMSDGFKNVGVAAATSTSKIGAWWASIGSAGQTAVMTGAAVGLAAGLWKCAEAAAEVQKITAQTNAVIKSTGGAANVTAGHVEDLGSKLRDLSGVDDEVIKSGQNLLLTFTKIRNETGKGNNIFDQATEASLDLSVAMGKDLRDSALKVGKALQDPVKGLTALRRYGVMFTDQQVEQAKALVKNNDLLGAQKIILAELAVEFGGSAAALGDTFAGKMNILKSNLNDVKEALGSLVLPQVTESIENLTTVFKGLSDAVGFIGAIKDKIGGLPAVLKWAGETAAKVAIPFKGVFDVINKAKNALFDWIGGGDKADKEIKTTESKKIKVSVDEKNLNEAKARVWKGWNVPVIKPTVNTMDLDQAKKNSARGWGAPTILPKVDMSLVTAAKTSARQGWSAILTPQVDMSQVTAAKTSAHQGWDVTQTVTVDKTGVPGSAIRYFDSPSKAGEFAGKKFAAGMGTTAETSVIVTVGTNAAAALALDDTLKRSTNALSVLAGTWGGFKSEMDARPFAEVENALVGITSKSAMLDISIQSLNKQLAELGADASSDKGNAIREQIRLLTEQKAIEDKNIPLSYSQLAIWRQVRGEYDASTASMKTYQDALDASEEKTTKWERAEELLNRQLDKHEATLSKLEGMKLAGEGAADDKSFALNQRINELSLAILQAKRAGNFELLASLNLQKKQLEKEKELHDLQTQVTYDPQERAREKALDASKGEEMSLADILVAIGKEQKSITSLTTKRDALAKKILAERDNQWLLKLEIDNTGKVVDEFKAKVDAMADAFLARYAEMKQAAEELAQATGASGGSAPPSMQTGGPILSTGTYNLHKGEFVVPALAPLNIGGPTTVVTVPLYLDGKKVAESTSKITARKSSAYARSGGGYR